MKLALLSVLAAAAIGANAHCEHSDNRPMHVERC